MGNKLELKVIYSHSMSNYRISGSHDLWGTIKKDDISFLLYTARFGLEESAEKAVKIINKRCKDGIRLES